MIDGVDQTDLLLGKNAKGARETFVFRNNDIRKGKWKYLKAKHNVYGYARGTTRKEVEELYDLAAMDSQCLPAPEIRSEHYFSRSNSENPERPHSPNVLPMSQ